MARNPTLEAIEGALPTVEASLVRSASAQAQPPGVQEGLGIDPEILRRALRRLAPLAAHAVLRYLSDRYGSAARAILDSYGGVAGISPEDWQTIRSILALIVPENVQAAGQHLDSMSIS